MTNHEIIEHAKQELLAQGLIKATGRVFQVEMEDGSIIQVPEAEEIHTFAAWKSIGYCVKKGQKAVAKIRIWKHTVKTETLPMEDGSQIEQEAQRMFMKDACFFSASQVERIA